MTNYRESQFLKISAAAEKALRHRVWKWCRLENHFLDMPLWRVVAFKAHVPLYAVQAFVTRLESFANLAEPRGYVGDFNVDEFAAGLGMTGDIAAKIYVALCDPSVRWIDQEHVATFHARNPDKPDENSGERKKRSRSRKDVRTKLAQLRRLDRVLEQERILIEAMLDGLEDEVLYRVQVRLANALSTGHEGHNVTFVDMLPIGPGLVRGNPANSAQNDVSIGHGGHIVTSRDIVTVTPRADQSLETTGPVDNSAAEPAGETAGLSIDEVVADDAISLEAEAWLGSEAVRIVVQRMQVPPTRAATLIERWRRDLDGDGAAMVAIITGADAANLSPSHFHVTVSEQVKRHIVTATRGQPLHLPPVLSREGGLPAPARGQPAAEPPASLEPASEAQPPERRKAANE
ncbi:MAG: hypothetical protein JWR80_4979 [Bradyrhizobium sp.]|nr:hypothetical protein [Bradyrhizobium sp.]